MPPKPVVAVLMPQLMQRRVLSRETLATLEALFTMLYAETSDETLPPDEVLALLAEADGCMTGWWSSQLSAEVLQRAPRLRVVAHAAGSVKSVVSEALWARGIMLTSANAVLVEDTAHFALALMILSRKNAFELSELVRRGAWREARERGHRPADDFRGCTVGLIGAGRIGRRLMELLPPFEVAVLLYDPYVSADEARALGAEKVELDELFRRSDIVSIHAPNLPETRHMVNAQQLALMQDGAVLINTARGALVDERALVNELQRRRIWAYLDVTDPEPPEPNSPLLACPNLTLTPHLGGSVGRCQLRLGALACEELRRFFAGEPQLYPVNRESLARSA